MKLLSQSNIFLTGAAAVDDLFSDYIQGLANPATCLTMAVSNLPLGQTAKNAIEKSLQSFGYGMGTCAYVTLYPHDELEEGADIALDAQSLFTLIEGLDPLVLVIADCESAALANTAYRRPVPLDASSRLLGRSVIAFSSLEKTLEEQDGKQRAWALFKKLPRASAH